MKRFSQNLMGVALAVLGMGNLAMAARLNSIEQAWNLAESTNSDILDARAELQNAQAERVGAWQKVFLPEVSLQTTYTQNLHIPPTTLPGSALGHPGKDVQATLGKTWVGTTGFQAQMAIFDLARARRTSVAQHTERLAACGIDAARDQIREKIAQKYFEAILNQELCQTSQQALDLADTSLWLSTQAWKEGRARESIKNQAADHRENVWRALQERTLDSENALLDLQLLLGMGPEDTLVLGQILSEPVIPSTRLEFPPSVAVVRAQERVDLAQQQLRDAQANFLPRLSVNWQKGLRQESDQAFDFGANAPLQESWGVRLETPLLAGGELSLAVRKAALALERTQRDLESVRRKQAIQDRQLELERENSTRQIESSRQKVAWMTENAQHALQLYREGAVGLDEKTKADADLIAARETRLRDLANAQWICAKQKNRMMGGQK